jgi:hypothetical protein
MTQYTLRRQKRFKNNCNLKRNKREGRYIRFLKVALFVARQTLPKYSHKKSPHIYSLPQLISCVLLKIYMKNMSFRGLEEFLLSSGDMCRVLGLRGVPNYSTFSRACNWIGGNQIKRLLGKFWR